MNPMFCVLLVAAAAVTCPPKAVKGAVYHHPSPSESFKSSKTPSSRAIVVVLTDSNFDSLVLNSDDVWLVEVYAPWCGHCKRLAPRWSAAAWKLEGMVKFGALDASVHSSKAHELHIKGYPTILFFAPGTTNVSEAKVYTGERTYSGIVNWAKNMTLMNF